MHSQFEDRKEPRKSENAPLDDSQVTEERWQELRLDGSPVSQDAQESPPIDDQGRELIRRVWEREASEEEERKLRKLTWLHDSWHDASEAELQRIRREKPELYAAHRRDCLQSLRTKLEKEVLETDPAELDPDVVDALESLRRELDNA